MHFANILPILLILASTSIRAEQGKHLFILSGQSNMVGLKPEVSFNPAVEKEFGKDHVIVVQDAQSGSPIRNWVKDWKPGAGKNVKAGKQPMGHLYERLMGKVKPAIAGQEIEAVTFVWMQGERDAKEGHGEVYATSFTMLIDQLKADLKRKDITFVIGRISDHGIRNGMEIPDWPVVREAQVKLAEADPQGAWVDTDDLNGPGDGLHYNAAGYASLGERFAEASIKLIKKSGTAPAR